MAASTVEPINNVYEVTAMTSGVKRATSFEMGHTGLAGVTKKFKKTEKLPDKLCKCRMMCSERVPQQAKEGLHLMYLKLDNRHARNKFLQAFIDVHPIANRLISEEKAHNGKLLKRIKCKYWIPTIALEDFMLRLNSDPDEDIYGKSMATKEENENDFYPKNFSRKSFNQYNVIDICRKAFLNLFNLSKKRLSANRDILTKKFHQKHKKITEKKGSPETESPINFVQGSLPLMILLDSELAKQISEPALISIMKKFHLVNDFFDNQLWKPEYFHD